MPLLQPGAPGIKTQPEIFSRALLPLLYLILIRWQEGSNLDRTFPVRSLSSIPLPGHTSPAFLTPPKGTPRTRIGNLRGEATAHPTRGTQPRSTDASPLRYGHVQGTLRRGTRSLQQQLTLRSLRSLVLESGELESGSGGRVTVSGFGIGFGLLLPGFDLLIRDLLDLESGRDPSWLISSSIYSSGIGQGGPSLPIHSTSSPTAAEHQHRGRGRDSQGIPEGRSALPWSFGFSSPHCPWRAQGGTVPRRGREPDNLDHAWIGHGGAPYLTGARWRKDKRRGRRPGSFHGKGEVWSERRSCP